MSEKAPAGPESYRRRAWCRAEQFCYTVRHGSHNLWLATTLVEAPVAVNAEWLDQALLVNARTRAHLKAAAAVSRRNARPPALP
jgi:hypothetical protein